MVRSKSLLPCHRCCCSLRDDALELCLEPALEEGLEDCLELATLLVLDAILPARPPAPNELVLLRGDIPVWNK